MATRWEWGGYDEYGDEIWNEVEYDDTDQENRDDIDYNFTDIDWQNRADAWASEGGGEFGTFIDNLRHSTPDWSAWAGANPEDEEALLNAIRAEVPDLAKATPEQINRAIANASLKLPENRRPPANAMTAIGNALKTPAGLLAAGAGIAGILGANKPQTSGYHGTIKDQTVIRGEIKQPEYVPYSGQATMGRDFFTPLKYVAPADAAAARTEAQGIAANMASQIPTAPAAEKSPLAVAQEAQTIQKPVTATGLYDEFMAKQNGLAKGRYLKGPTDGMADKIPSSIEGKQPAALSHGEFVIPADVVSHLGNGNSDSGAQNLYKMMDRVRKARTGTAKQGKEINPEKMMPTGVAKFQAGGGTGYSGLAPSSNTQFGSTAVTTLSPWVGDYVTNMLSKGQALANETPQTYQGPLTAGVSPLQKQAFDAAGKIDPSATFNTEALQAYMNPYTQLALQPQLDELRRQSQINQQNLQGQFTRAGAFGGGRETLARTEGQRSLDAAQAGLIGKGFENAFTQAMNQYNTGRNQQLQDLAAVSGMGQQQRGIEQEGITALQKQFEQQKLEPMERLRFQQGLLQGLPIGATEVTPNISEMDMTNLTLEQAQKIFGSLSKIPGFSDLIMSEGG